MFVQDRRHSEISLDFTVTHLVGYKMSVKVLFLVGGLTRNCNKFSYCSETKPASLYMLSHDVKLSLKACTGQW